MIEANVPVLGFSAYSGTGKTTLLRQLIPLLKASGTGVALIKHAHHRFDIDKPGKDSYELRKSGADQVLIASSQRWALMVEKPVEAEPDLQDMVDQLDQHGAGLILVEGFKNEELPKIELVRSGFTQTVHYPVDPNIIAVASDGELPEPTTLPVLDLNSPEVVARFIRAWLGQAN